MTATERQHERLETLLARVRRQHADIRPRRHAQEVATDHLRNALAKLSEDLDPLPLGAIYGSSPALRYGQTSIFLRERPSTLDRIVRGKAMSRRAIARVTRTLIIEGLLPETSP